MWLELSLRVGTRIREYGRSKLKYLCLRHKIYTQKNPRWNHNVQYYGVSDVTYC